MLRSAVQLWKNGSFGQAVFLSLFSTPFIAAEVFLLFLFFTSLGVIFIFALTGLIIVTALFGQWLRAPTEAGAEVIEQIRNFAMYLRTAESSRLQHVTSSLAVDMDLFQRYLPHALALDVSTAWARHFTHVMAGGDGGSMTSPWYRSSSLYTNPAAFSDAVSGSFGASIMSSASANSSSSSGSSGGGSSGGGGGGGGGGGW